MMMNGWGWGPGTMHWGWGYGGGIVMILIVAGLIVGGVLLIRWALSQRDGRWHGTIKKPKTAEEILDERYAQGEISRDEYMQIKTDLGEKG